MSNVEDDHSKLTNKIECIFYPALELNASVAMNLVRTTV